MTRNEVIDEVNAKIREIGEDLANACIGMDAFDCTYRMTYDERDVSNALHILLHVATAYGVRNGTLTVSNMNRNQRKVAKAVEELAGVHL